MVIFIEFSTLALTGRVSMQASKRPKKSINQYPRTFCESILKDTLQRLLTHKKAEKLDEKLDHSSLLLTQYLG